MTEKLISLAIVCALAFAGYWVWKNRPWEDPCVRVGRRCHQAPRAGAEAVLSICGDVGLGAMKRDQMGEAECRGINQKLDAAGAAP